ALLDRIGAALHRLRGSALVVNEEAAAEEAGRLAAACARGVATSADLAQGLAQIVTALRLAPPIVTPEDGATLREARALFLEEARGLHADATALFEALGRDSASRAADVRAELAALLHRLKGSAAVVAHDAIAGEAAALHDVLASEGGSSSHGVLRDGLAR